MSNQEITRAEADLAEVVPFQEAEDRALLRAAKGFEVEVDAAVSRHPAGRGIKKSVVVQSQVELSLIQDGS